MIDVVLDVSGIYGLGPSHEAVRAAAAAAAAAKTKGPRGFPDEPITSTTTNVSTITSATTPTTLISETPAEELEGEIVDQDSAYDSESASVIRLSNGMVRI